MPKYDDETIETHGTDFRTKGYSHELRIFRNCDDDGWLIDINMGRGATEAICNLPDEFAHVLAEHLSKHSTVIEET